MILSDLLEREDFEALNHLTADEEKLSTEGTSVLISLRNVLKVHNQVKNAQEHELGENVFETESRLIDLVNFADVKGEHGRNHGLAFRFRRHLNTLRESKQWEALVARSTCCGCSLKPVRI